MKSLKVLAAMAVCTTTAVINGPVMADKPVTPGPVTLYSAPLTVEDGIGCQNTNTTQNTLDVTIELINHLGSPVGRSLNTLPPQGSAGNIFFNVERAAHVCKWMYEGNVNDLRAVVVTYRQVEGKPPTAIIAVPAIPNVSVPKNQANRD